MDSKTAMEAAVTSSNLAVVFQPIVDLKTRTMFAVEALARCNLPKFRSPEVLFEHAVKNKYCGRLGRALREITFARCSGIRCFVNIHPLELSERWIVRPDDPIFSHDHEVYVEITESVPFSHYDLCVSVLRELRQRGQMHLVIDDLGSGYSNFKRISDLYPEFVKLDIDLITGIENNQRQQELVSSTVSLCTNMGADVIAEGIETAEELKAVMGIGIRYGQGFLFGKPEYPIPELKWPLIDGKKVSAR